jgi:hypothetical protein
MLEEHVYKVQALEPKFCALPLYKDKASPCNQGNVVQLVEQEKTTQWKTLPTLTKVYKKGLQSRSATASPPHINEGGKALW